MTTSVVVICLLRRGAGRTESDSEKAGHDNGTMTGTSGSPGGSAFDPDVSVRMQLALFYYGSRPDRDTVWAKRLWTKGGVRINV